MDHQPVIRQNRDTLYSGGVVAISRGATVTIPGTDGRYLAVMPINQDGYVNTVYDEPGIHELTVQEFDTVYVMLPVRILVDDNDADDIAAARQDQVIIESNAARPFTLPDYDPQTFTATRDALLELAKGLPGFGRAFGSRA